MNNQPLKQVKGVQQFLEFSQKLKGPFCDFQEVENGKELLNSLVGIDAESYFTVIGMQKSHSLICFWKYKDNISLQEQPIVWLDSEGSPYAVFAPNFQAVLSLLPYDTGAIYDLVAAWERYWDNPDQQESPIQRFSTDIMQMYAKRSRDEYPFHEQFLEWLREEMKIEPASQAATLIGEAGQCFPRLSEWLTEKQFEPL